MGSWKGREGRPPDYELLWNPYRRGSWSDKIRISMQTVETERTIEWRGSGIENESAYECHYSQQITFPMPPFNVSFLVPHERRRSSPSPPSLYGWQSSCAERSEGNPERGALKGEGKR